MLLAEESAADQNQDPHLKAAPPAPVASPAPASIVPWGAIKHPQVAWRGSKDRGALGVVVAGWDGMSSPPPSPLLLELRRQLNPSGEAVGQALAKPRSNHTFQAVGFSKGQRNCSFWPVLALSPITCMADLAELNQPY